MDRINTISEFLETTRTHFRVFDIGRRIVKLGKQTFEQFEAGTLPYPFPLQQQAWFAVLGWNPSEADEHFVWFLKFPLDETGCLVQPTRDDFLGHLLQSALPRDEGIEAGLADAMNDSPYGFKPREQTMAAFHAKALQTLGKPPSKFYAHARDYLAGGPGYEQWAFVGIQGLADIAARIGEAELEALVVKAIPHLPAPPLQALCSCLENEPVSTAVSEALVQRIVAALTETRPDSNLISACIRGLSYSKAKGMRQEALQRVLESPMASDISLLAAIASRCWEDLHDKHLCRLFMEALASNTLGQDAFNQVVVDLLFIPGMRETVLTTLRDPQRTRNLEQAVGQLFKNRI